MIRLIEPLTNTEDFNRLTSSLSSFLNDPESFRFLSYTLVRFDKKFIEEQTKNHKEIGLEYLVNEEDGFFNGILALKRNPVQGFELFLLVVDRKAQKMGIGQNLINNCIRIAKNENYKCVDSFVFADNKNMLRLLIQNNFRPIEILHAARADGMDLVKLRFQL
jgi:ribosomal protein S18 acetylase RimI-like enzyme